MLQEQQKHQHMRQIRRTLLHSLGRLLANKNSLYITNLPSSKIQKSDLRISLYTLFSTYGPVLDVVALRTMKMRGQAHVVYRDIHTATQAMRALQGFDFFGRELVNIIQPYKLQNFHILILSSKSPTRNQSRIRSPN